MAETMPPVTADDLRKYLENESFSVYLYLGREADKGWKYARIVYGLLARLRIYLVEDPELVKEWTANRDPRGVVFGWGPEPKRYLSGAEAEDLETFLEAITQARS